MAVLAFKAQTPSPEQNLFAAGVATEIIGELARNRDVRVLARDSSFAVSNQALTPTEIGSKLRVRYLVDGTVQRIGEVLVLGTQLVDARDGTVAWAETFKVKAAQVGELSETISKKVTSVLYSGMRETEKKASLRRSPKDLDVYELTLRGLALKHQFSVEATRAGRSALEEAIRRDPDYAPAWLNLGWLNLVDILNQFTGEWRIVHLDQVIAQFNRSIELDPTLSMAYQGLSRATVFAGDIPQALALIKRALELGPSDADNLLFYATTEMQMGNLSGALHAVGAALELNPIRPSYYHRHYSEILWANMDYERALEESKECLRKASKFTHCTIFTVVSLTSLEKLDEATRVYTEAVSRIPNFTKAVKAIAPRPPQLAERYWSALNRVAPHVFVVSTSAH